MAAFTRQGSRFTATIPPHDLQSFVTDTHQTWLTQPQSPRLPTPASNTIHFLDQDSDFVLFPSTVTNARPQPTQARSNSELAQATSRIALNHRSPTTYPGQQLRRNSTQQSASSVSPIQNPRVSGIIYGTGSPSSSPSTQQYNSPTGQQTHFYANSAPTSTVGLHQQSPRSRPPVPLFANSTGSIPQHTMANTNTFEDPSNSMFNFDDFTVSNPHDGLFDAPLNFDTSFEPINELASDQQTISPKDIFMNDTTSAPPSGAFTDLTTPGTSAFESPYMANSTETSPLFTDNPSFEDDPDKWPSLFAETEEHARPTTSTPYYLDSPKTSHVAPKMSRNGSSPGQPSSRQSHKGRGSFAAAAGVAPKRRDKPLPDIKVEDPNDIIAVKRARNTLAARKSREKRVEQKEALVIENSDLKEDVAYWKGIAMALGHDGQERR